MRSENEMKVEFSRSTHSTGLICYLALALEECPKHKIFIEGDCYSCAVSR